MSELLAGALILVRAEESGWAVLFGGLVPLFGFLAVLYIVVKAVRDNDESDELPLPPPPAAEADEASPPSDQSSRPT